MRKLTFFSLSEVNSDQVSHINKDKLCIGGNQLKIRKDGDRQSDKKYDCKNGKIKAFTVF